MAGIFVTYGFDWTIFVVTFMISLNIHSAFNVKVMLQLLRYILDIYLDCHFCELYNFCQKGVLYKQCKEGV